MKGKEDKVRIDDEAASTGQARSVEDSSGQESVENSAPSATEVPEGIEEASSEKESDSGKGPAAAPKRKLRGATASRKKLLSEIEGLHEQNRISQQEILDLKDSYLRIRAEFDNFRKRTSKERSDLIRSASGRVLGNLLDIIDDFDRAISKGNTEDPFKKGIELIYSRFIDLLNREGLEEIDAIGEKFDPAVHEAVFQVESADHEEDTVASVIKKGYRMDGKVFRPAAVGVYKNPEPATVEGDEPPADSGEPSADGEEPSNQTISASELKEESTEKPE